MVDTLGQHVTSMEISFYTDASGSIGFGSLLNRKWIQGFWEKDFLKSNKPSIEYLELFALAAGILTWQNQPELVNNRITVFCDNTAVVQMINNMTSSCEHCMKLIRILVLDGLKFNRRLSAKYIDTKSNFLADSLSRGQWEHFRKLGPQMNVVADQIHESIWPVEKVW